MKRLISLLLVLALTTPLAFASAASPAEIDKLNEIITVIERNYHDEVDSEALIEAAYKGVLSALDKHSDYIDATALERYNSAVSGSFVGVGIKIKQTGDYVEVIEPIADSPAEAAGFLSGDIIIAVDGQSIQGKPLSEVVALIKGQIGTVVSLTVERADRAQPLVIAVKRDLVVVKSVMYRRRDGVDIIKITSFDSDTARELAEILSDRALGDKIIIDLRGNPGGLLDQVVAAADLFLDEGQAICSVDYRVYQDQQFSAQTAAATADLVVLIDGDSASAAELFAGAMQDNQRAKIVGQTSYGKGTVQSLYHLADGTALKLTIGKYATPNGRFIDGVGIIPDVVVTGDAIVEQRVDNFYPMQSLNTSKLGSRDIDTYGLQQRLDYLGYAVDINGQFDAATERALKTYQAERGLAVDGRLTVDVKIAIQREVVALATTKGDAALAIALRMLN